MDQTRFAPDNNLFLQMLSRARRMPCPYPRGSHKSTQYKKDEHSGFLISRGAMLSDAQLQLVFPARHMRGQSQQRISNQTASRVVSRGAVRLLRHTCRSRLTPFQASVGTG